MIQTGHKLGSSIGHLLFKEVVPSGKIFILVLKICFIIYHYYLLD
jgi:hypothetical protein